jgi:hypothetical protein
MVSQCVTARLKSFLRLGSAPSGAKARFLLRRFDAALKRRSSTSLQAARWHADSGHHGKERLIAALKALRHPKSSLRELLKFGCDSLAGDPSLRLKDGSPRDDPSGLGVPTGGKYAVSRQISKSEFDL